MLESICAHDKKKSVKHELDSKYYPVMLDFYKESYYFTYLLNFNGGAAMAVAALHCLALSLSLPLSRTL
jgi:hypothetical protein